MQLDAVAHTPEVAGVPEAEPPPPPPPQADKPITKPTTTVIPSKRLKYEAKESISAPKNGKKDS